MNHNLIGRCGQNVLRCYPHRKGSLTLPPKGRFPHVTHRKIGALQRLFRGLRALNFLHHLRCFLVNDVRASGASVFRRKNIGRMLVLDRVKGTTIRYLRTRVAGFLPTGKGTPFLQIVMISRRFYGNTLTEAKFAGRNDFLSYFYRGNGVIRSFVFHCCQFPV